MSRLAGMLIAGAVVLVGCGRVQSTIGDPVKAVDTTPPETNAIVPTTPSQRRYQVTAMVLQSHDHGPQLCAGATPDLYPPSCSGPDVVGFDWSSAPGSTSANGTTWGSYTLIGTWDGKSLILTAPPRSGSQVTTAPSTLPDLSSPCPVPDGGWRVTDMALVSMSAYENISTAAQAQPDIGGMWVDQSINPAGAVNDFTRMVVNVSFTGDLERHDRELRALWGGALCVSRAAISARALASRRADVERVVGPFLWSSADERAGTIEIQLFLDDRGLQAQFDERYGAGTVRIKSLLQPTAT